MPHDWSIKEIRDLVMAKFGKRACWLQIKIALALRAKKDVVACAPTGAGKTLSFWIALLMALADSEDKMIFVVTPLNLLGKQNVESLEKAGINAVAVSKENANPDTFRDIEVGKHNVVIINPEILMKNNGGIEKLWAKPHVTKRILYITFDEGHCITQWGAFRKEYLNVGQLRYLIPGVPFYVASATLPPSVLLDVTGILRLRHDQTEYIMRSNDRPEICLMVQKLVFPATSFRDLSFLIPKDYQDGDPPIPKFLVFFDSTKEAEAACRYLRSLLPESCRHRIKYFHSTMTQAYREEEVAEMKNGDTWGKCCTDAFGMGVDLPDIKIVVQYKATCNLCTLWQRFGRVARGTDQEGVAILLVEKKDTAEERVAAAERAAKRKEKNREGIGTKRKATNTRTGAAKRLALADRAFSRGEGEDEIEVLSTDVAEHGQTSLGDEEVNVELEAFKAERRAYYKQGSSKGQTVPPKGKAHTGVEIGGPMDDYINSNHLRCTPCRRIIPTLFFGNDLTPSTDHLLCDPDSLTGCARCTPKVSLICCDLCHPNLLEQYRVIFEGTPRAPAKYTVKPFTMSQTDRDLKAALFSWRRTHAVTKFGSAAVRSLGAKQLLSDQLVDRVIGCARDQKIQTIADLIKETHWKWAEDLGESLLIEIHKVFPPPAPLAAQNAESGSTRLAKRVVRCSKCKAEGHISSNSNCPVRIAEKAIMYQGSSSQASTPTAQPNENTPPAPQSPVKRHPRSQPHPLRDPLLPATSMVPAPPLPPPAQPPSIPSYYQHLLDPTFLRQPLPPQGYHPH